VHDNRDPYRRMLDAWPDGAIVVRDRRITFANSAAVRLLGASSSDEILDTPLLDVIDPDAHQLLGERIEQWMSGRSAPRMDARLVRHDGTTIEVEIAGGPTDEEQAGVQLALRDVTDARRAERALRESEERLTLAFAGAQEGVWDWNLETGAVVYSARWKQMLGYADEEIEPHVSAWERLLHPDDRARAEEVHAAVIGGAPSYELEVRLRHKEGHYIHVLSRGVPIRREPDGLVVRIVGTHFDLTERNRAEATLRESEERLTLAFAGAQEGVWDWNLETGAVVYSPRWKQMLGYADEEIEPHVSAWERLLHPDDRACAEEVHAAVIGGAPSYELEVRLRHKEGHYIHVLSRGLPVRREPGGPVVRIVGTHFDLTERRRADAERARTELLTRLVFVQEDERRRIAREMHDQFGEQLTALARGIDALKAHGADDSGLRARIDLLERIARQLDRDVDHLVWELRPTALDDLGLRAALANYVEDWSKRVGIPVALHCTGLLDDRLSSEAETTLYRIAQEALTNVAKHSRATHVEIILERRGDSVLLIVEDDGIGFESGSDERRASGFGLLGMHERAALVGARLQIESSAGQGTTVFLRMAAGAARPAVNHA
jgi:PAS domain S-box-containing protein